MKLIVVSSAYDLENEIGLIELMFQKDAKVSFKKA